MGFCANVTNGYGEREFLQIAVYRSADRLMSLSVHGDMKGEVQALPERTPPKEETHGFFLRYPSS